MRKCFLVLTCANVSLYWHALKCFLALTCANIPLYWLAQLFLCTDMRKCFRPRYQKEVERIKEAMKQKQAAARKGAQAHIGECRLSYRLVLSRSTAFPLVLFVFRVPLLRLVEILDLVYIIVQIKSTADFTRIPSGFFCPSVLSVCLSVYAYVCLSV